MIVALLSPCFKKLTNQIFNYTRCITPKRATKLQDPSPRHCACRQHSPFQKNVAAMARLSTLSDLSSSKFEPKTSRSRDEGVTARPTCGYSKVTLVLYFGLNLKVLLKGICFFYLPPSSCSFSAAATSSALCCP